MASSPHGTPSARSSVGASTTTHAKDTTGIRLRTASGSVADRGKRGAVRAQSAEHDLELRRDQQRGGQAEVSDERGVPSPAGAAVRGPHALTVPAQPAPGIIRSERADHPQV